MKVAPPSADLLIKLALVAVAVGVMLYTAKKVTSSVSSALDSIASLPGQFVDSVVEVAQEGGQAWQAQTTERPPEQHDYYGRYQGPLVNDSGMDFGQLSG